ncbi:MAG TPA: hypothetical protein VHL98_10890 [Microvirga sp.]|nr:hypothetical protein [Microvirga sp.]
MPYPSRRDFEDRFHVVRRRDAFHCLEVAAQHRRQAIREAALNGGFAPSVFIKLASDALRNARRYDQEARVFGLRLPGEEEGWEDLMDLPSPSDLDLAAEAALQAEAA